MKTIKIVTVALFISTPVSVQALNPVRGWGAFIGTLCGAGVGISSYLQEKKAHHNNPELNKKPKKWYSYVVNSAAAGAMCGWGVAEAKLFYHSIIQKIRIENAYRNTLLKNDLKEEEIEMLRSINVKVDRLYNKKISAFDVLGINPNMPPEEIHRTAKKVLRKHHTDKKKAYSNSDSNAEDRDVLKFLECIATEAYKKIGEVVPKPQEVDNPQDHASKSESPQQFNNNDGATAENTDNEPLITNDGKYGHKLPITILNVD